jgi:hypothetical protein
VKTIERCYHFTPKQQPAHGSLAGVNALLEMYISRRVIMVSFSAISSALSKHIGQEIQRGWIAVGVPRCPEKLVI